jgi:hypothetical protein
MLNAAGELLVGPRLVAGKEPCYMLHEHISLNEAQASNAHYSFLFSLLLYRLLLCVANPWFVL